MNCFNTALNNQPDSCTYDSVIGGYDAGDIVSRSKAGYELLAPEYYIPARHPTCANFDLLHQHVLELLQDFVRPDGHYLEVGCGRGRLDLVCPKSQVLLTDIVEGMVSLAFQRTGGECRCCVLDVMAPDMPQGQCNGIGAFLADPYNIPRFFSQMHGLLAPKGFLVVTLPSHFWASVLRRRLGMRENETTFILLDRSTIVVPSLTRSTEDQVEMMKVCGFNVELCGALSLNDLDASSSPSHHVRLAAEAVGLAPEEFPLLDYYLVIK